MWAGIDGKAELWRFSKKLFKIQSEKSKIVDGMDENLLDGYIFPFFLDQKNKINIIEINNYFLVKFQWNTECGLLEKQFYFTAKKSCFIT